MLIEDEDVQPLIQYDSENTFVVPSHISELSEQLINSDQEFQQVSLNFYVNAIKCMIM